jgi:hypothetical protein
VEQFHWFRKYDAVAIDQTDGTSIVTLKCRDHIARGIVKSLQGFAVNLDETPAGATEPLEERCRRVRRRAAGMPYQREVEVVAKQRCASKTLAILRIQRSRRTSVQDRRNTW